jgi:hypothetical protein
MALLLLPHRISRGDGTPPPLGPTRPVWLYGGFGIGSLGRRSGSLDDLWEFSPRVGVWTWVGGSQGIDAFSGYGSLGAASTVYAPTARQRATSWTDVFGNMWLFGGTGVVSTGTVGDLNDLWQYNPSLGAWTWVSRSNLGNSGGVYGTLGSASSSNMPAARSSGSSWTDNSGNLWLFGGSALTAGFGSGLLSDLWEFSPGNPRPGPRVPGHGSAARARRRKVEV